MTTQNIMGARMAGMASELANLHSYGKHLAKCLLAGSLAEACSTSAVMAIRSLEAVRDLWAAPRVTCEFCGWRGCSFRTFVAGATLRRGAVCPRCLSLERHRDFLRLFRDLRALLPPHIDLLDIAPTRAFSDYCTRAPDIAYLSIDEVSPIAMRHMDVQALELPSDSFDVVVCYHVLDYVPDDVQALREIRRVLRASGFAILQEVISDAEATVEWHRPMPEHLHRIRRYGRDFFQRLERAGLRFVTMQRLTGPVILAAKSEHGTLDRLAAGTNRASPSSG